MMTPVQAMLWQTWRGWRWGLVMEAAYLLVAAVVAQLLPSILHRMSLGEGALVGAGQQLAMPCSFILIHLVAVFTLSGAHDLKTKGYSSKMFVLPVRTRTLVVWPMIWGCLALGCVWLFMACLILRPTGNAAPLVWPIAALAAVLTLLQALQWLPLHPNWLSLVLAVALILVVVILILGVAIFQVPEPIATGIFLGLLPLTYAGGMHGVVLTRRGDAYDWKTWNRLVAWANEWRKPAEHPFRSATRAQLWYECRSFGWLFPFFTAMLSPFFALLELIEQGSNADSNWKQLVMLLMIPAGLAVFLAMEFGKPSFPFIATRPISTATLVRGKFAMALVSALAAYIPILLVVPVFFVWPGLLDSAHQIWRSAGTPKAAAILLLGVTLPLLLTWKGLAENFWLGFAGRDWLNSAVAFSFAALMGCGTLFGLWVWFHPELQALLWSLVPWVVGLLLALKLTVAACVVFALVRSRLVTPQTVGLFVGVWGLVALVLSLLAAWLIPEQLLPVSGVLAGVMLCVPFSRLAGAPLSLAWNRHR